MLWDTCRGKAIDLSISLGRVIPAHDGSQGTFGSCCHARYWWQDRAELRKWHTHSDVAGEACGSEAREDRSIILRSIRRLGDI